MKKAFDLVSLIMLEKVLLRIKMPKIIIKFFLSLYSRRKIKVITEHKLTKEFEAEDSFNQEKVVSSLM